MFEDWIGKEELRTDFVDKALLTRWCATLDRPGVETDMAPQGLHWCLGVPDTPTAKLGRDGHPARDNGPDSFLPPIKMERRMWASSRVEFHHPLTIGKLVQRRSRIRSITEKQGQSGPLVFIEVDHETECEGRACISELQSIVYRDAQPEGAVLTPAPPGPDSFDPAAWDVVRVITPLEPLLFRYSALTFNSHRIHYDLPYAEEVEGYRGLVVQGPLNATLLLDLARRELGEQAFATFSFRGVSPAICGEPLRLVLRAGPEGYLLGIFCSNGRKVMDAAATVRN